MILQAGEKYPTYAFMHISDPCMRDFPWTSIGNCLPGIWKARKTDLGLEICHEDYLEANSYKDWISSERTVEIDTKVLMVSTEYNSNEFEKIDRETVGKDWVDVEYAMIEAPEGSHAIYLRINKDGLNVGIWVEAVQNS